MSATTNSVILKLLTALALLFTLIQGLLPTMPPIDPETLKIISAFILYGSAAVTIWKQYLSEAIANKAIKRTLWLAVIATVAGLIDFINVFHLSDIAAQWIRFGFNVAVAFFNVYSKLIWPSESEEQRIALKNESL